MNSMENKTVLADVGGFTPVIDTIVQDLGLVCAGVFGVIWRYCQMRDGKCTASQSRIAENLKISTHTVQRCAEKLVSAGYLKSVLIDGVGVEYYDTGLAGLRIQVTGYSNKESLPSADHNTKSDLRQIGIASDSKLEQLPMPNWNTKKEVKKELKETPTTTADGKIGANSEVAEVFKAYESEIGLLTNYVREEVLDAIERYPRDWIIEAIKEASKNNARKWSYVEAVLKSWQTNGYKTDVRSKRANNWRKPKAPDMGGYEVDHTSEIVINDNGEAFDGELQY